MIKECSEGLGKDGSVGKALTLQAGGSELDPQKMWTCQVWWCTSTQRWQGGDTGSLGQLASSRLMRDILSKEVDWIPKDDT